MTLGGVQLQQNLQGSASFLGSAKIKLSMHIKSMQKPIKIDAFTTNQKDLKMSSTEVFLSPVL